MPRKNIALGVLALPFALALGSLPAQALPIMPADLPTLAQSQPQTQAPAEGDVGGFSQSQLQSYANAVAKIQQIDRAWQPRIQQAESEAEAETLVTQATDEMVGEIEAQGLSVQEYNAITQAAETDERLYDQIRTLLAQR